MNLVIRGIAVYLFILIVFMVAGKKTISEATTFDFVLLLIISEVAQQALFGKDYSLSGCFILVATLVGIDLLLAALKFKSHKLGNWSDGHPLIIINKGVILHKRMRLSIVLEEDILHAALQNGISILEEIEYGVLEKDGSISIIPKKG